LAAREEDRLLKEQIKLDDSLNKERRLKLAKQELERKRQQSLEQLDDGELASREMILDETIRIEGHEGSWTTWNLFGGRREMLWTTYIAEPIEKDGTIDPHFVRTTVPTLWAQVIDFNRPFYLTDQGKKKVDSLVTEIRRLQIIKSDHILRVYGVKRDRTPKGGERVVVFVERPVYGGLLKSRLPSSGFDCPTAIVSFSLLSFQAYTDAEQEYHRQIMTGLSAVHQKNGTQRRMLFSTLHS
jgi:translation initiation factor 2-alpha kinase 4